MNPTAPTFQFTDFDLHLFQEGSDQRLYNKLGAHPGEKNGVMGVYFAVWAPAATAVQVLGSFNQWQEGQDGLHPVGHGIWAGFVPGAQVNDRYQYQIGTATGDRYRKADPVGFYHEVRPRTASIVTDLKTYTWGDQAWMAARTQRNPLDHPLAVYEVHLGSWMHGSTADPPPPFQGQEQVTVPISGYRPQARFLTYPELADRLIPYVKSLGYTHIELLPIAEHPFDGCWGYQVTGYYAPTSRFGCPQGLMYLIDRCHQEGLGVILDWVPGHFSRDLHGLGKFDGSALYEYADDRRGEHKEWGTLVFNYGSAQVRNFLLANALFWFDYYHIDGLRVDAVASMLYLDYGRKPGEWLPNPYGGRENIEAADFLRQVNHALFTEFPGILTIAEESSMWPMVSWPTYVGGLGFNLKWNMGWMHDVLDYFQMESGLRQYHQNNLTFPMWYHHSENFMIALSHDEVVHGKSSILGKMAGDEWQKYANLRCLLTFMYAHPGKKTLFMGIEFAQWNEWNVWGVLDWDLLNYPPHQKIQTLVKDLQSLYCQEPSLYTADFEESGFQWIDCSDHRHSVISFLRRDRHSPDFLVIVGNFTPQPHAHYRIGVPTAGFYQELFNSDSRQYGGSNLGNLGGKPSEDWPFHGFPYSLDLCLPPLAVLILKLSLPRLPA